MDKNELRLDPLTRDWTIFNESRALPPVTTSVRDDVFAESPFRAGLEHFAAHALHHSAGESGWQVRVVPNRLPVLRVEGDSKPQEDGLYEHLDAVGANEIVIEDPGTRNLEELPTGAIAQVIRAWAVRIEDLMRDFRLRSFTVVKSAGRAAGQTVGHSLSQIIAMAVVPPALRRKLRHARDHFLLKKRSLFADIIAHERRNASRVVRENADFFVFCPYAARSPFELAIWPKRQCPDFHHITHEEAVSLADALGRALRKLNRAINYPPYHLTLTTAPSRVVSAEDWETLDDDFRWHITITPVLRPPDALPVEMGCYVNGIWPEVAADYLRSLPDAP
jgi:UDPglucose--hexose-1-phosphate uridylyltransferase